VETDLRKGIIRDVNQDLCINIALKNGGYELLIARGTPEERIRRADEIARETGRKIKPIEDSDELGFQHVTRTRREIQDAVTELAQKIWYYDVYQSSVEGGSAGVRKSSLPSADLDAMP
jgi:hypothetical protein